jgi:hypothetical protein
MKYVIAMFVALGTIGIFVWNNGPRLVSDVLHADFVPAHSYRLTDYSCTTWNVVLFNECTATFTAAGGGASRQITDWRFGSAPSAMARLLQRRTDATAVTTDVSLQTLWNRLALALTLLLFGTLLVLSFACAAVLKPDDAPADARRMR